MNDPTTTLVVILNAAALLIAILSYRRAANKDSAAFQAAFGTFQATVTLEIGALKQRVQEMHDAIYNDGFVTKEQLIKEWDLAKALNAAQDLRAERHEQDILTLRERTHELSNKLQTLAVKAGL